MRAIARAEAKKEVAIAEIAKELLGKRLRRGAKGTHDYATARFRESDLLRRVFETVLQRCIREGLVGGETFAIDASLIKADANRQKGIEGETGLAPEASGRAIQDDLAVLDDAAFGAATDVTPN